MASFQNDLLARLNASSAAAKAAKARAQAERVKAAREAAARKAEAERRKHHEEVTKMLRRNAPSGSLRARSRPKASGGARRKRRDKNSRDAEEEEEDPSFDRPKRPISHVRPGVMRNDNEPKKPLPNMEFVVRKSQPAKINVPHTSDYSDLFGDQYLLGIDLKVTSDMAKESAVATKESQRILAEKKEETERLRREAERRKMEEREMARKGLLTDKIKNERRYKESAKGWVTVDKPVAGAAAASAAVKSAAMRQAADSSSQARPADRGKSGKSGSAAEAVKKQDLEERKRALQQRLMGSLGGGSSSIVKPKAPSPKPVSRKRDRYDGDDDNDVQAPRKMRRADSDGRLARRRAEDEDDDRRRRRRSQDSDDDRPSRRIPASKRRRSYPDDSDGEPPRYRHVPSKKSDRYSDRGYNSDEWSEGGSSPDDEEDHYGIDALDREEELSWKFARQEDLRERQLEAKRKKEKEEKRRAALR